MPKIKTKLIIIFILGILIFFCLWIFKKTTPSVSQVVKDDGSVFFTSLSITNFSPGGAPCINVEIEDKRFMFKLDLGFNGNVSLSSSLLQTVNEKSFAFTKPMWGWQGNKYSINAYKIPKIRIGSLTLHQPILEEEIEVQKRDAVIIWEKDASNTSPPVGKVGWKLFNNMTLFLDLTHSNIAISDSIETFKKKGCSLEGFTKVPLISNNGLIEFETMTSKGLLKCVLDTGCTYNIFNTDNSKDRPIEEMILDEKNFVKFPAFQIGDNDFGPITFHPLTLKLPIHIEAILGMEFMLDHQIFIDFKNCQIYFSAVTENIQKKLSLIRHLP